MHYFRTLYLRMIITALILATNGSCYCSSYVLPPKGGALKSRKTSFLNQIHRPAYHNHYGFRTVSFDKTEDIKISEVVPATEETPTTSKLNSVALKNVDVPGKLSKLDFVVFVTYFCNIAAVTLSVVTVPAMAIEHNLNPQAASAFCASVAGMASLGGGLGKLVNGFVCQYLGGQRSSWIYLVALSSLKLYMSFSRSLAPIGLILVGIDFLSSIQWTSISALIMEQYDKSPAKLLRGITVLSLSSTIGALAAKTFGAGLLAASGWRTVCRFGSLMALIGSAAMYIGGDVVPSVNNIGNERNLLKGRKKQNKSALAAIKSIFSNPIFWMFGIGHSLGSLARSSDRLIGPFLQHVGGISSSLAAGLTSSVTIGFVFGLLRGNRFSKMDTIKEKMEMIKKNRTISVLAALGLAVCGIDGVSQLVGGNTNLLIPAITLLSGLVSSAVSFQFYQFGNLMSVNIFPEHKSVALSFTDAVGFFTTAGVLGVNSHLLGNFGWCASWAFIATAFAVGGSCMARAMQPVLVQVSANHQ